ncbi:MAG: hypothetical protein HZB18_01380 [Chloroflexi bacterium]|nr:hypothetical protein [Chloroflexota bacterium]
MTGFPVITLFLLVASPNDETLRCRKDKTLTQSRRDASVHVGQIANLTYTLRLNRVFVIY